MPTRVKNEKWYTTNLRGMLYFLILQLFYYKYKEIMRTKTTYNVQLTIFYMAICLDLYKYIVVEN